MFADAGEALRHLVERDRARDEAGQVDSPLESGLREEREVLPRNRVAAVGDCECDPRPEELCVEIDVEPRAWRGEADDRRPARVGAHPDRLRERRRTAAREEGELGTAAIGQLANGLDRIGGGRVDDVGRPECAGVLELLRRDVDRDDLSRVAQQCSLDDREPDAATADHDDGGVFPHRRRPEGRSRTRREAAREQRRLLDRQLLRHLDRARLVHDRLVGERAAAKDGRQLGAVHRPVHSPLRAELRGAAARIAPPALRALAARRPPGDDDAVPGCDHGHVAAHLLDDPGALVAEQDREPRAPALGLDDVEVGVAEPASLDADEHLTRSRRIDRELLDGRRRVGLGVDDAARHSSVTVAATGLESVTSPAAAARRAIPAAA